MKPAHARLRLAPGKIELRNGAGAFHTAAGLRAAADDEWQEVLPLDVITTGTTRFAFGPPTAQWATIADHGELNAGASRPSKPPSESLETALLAKIRALAIPISLLILVVAIGASFLIAVNRGALSPGAREISDVAMLRAAFDQFSFGRTVQVKEDVDGAIYVTGFVESPVERRAILGAIDKTGVPVASDSACYRC